MKRLFITERQPENKIRRKYKKYGLKKMERYYMKKEENRNLIQPGDENKIVMMTKAI